MNQQQAIATVRRAFGVPGSKPYPRYRRIGPVAGLTGLACYTAGSLTAALPGPATATTTVTAHIAATRGSVLTGVALMFLALPFLLVFLGFLGDLLAAPAVVIWRCRALPRWLAGLALLGVAASVAELAGLAVTKGTDAGGYVAGAGPVLWVLWAAALAVTALAAKPRAADPVTGAPATPPNGLPTASAS